MVESADTSAVTLHHQGLAGSRGNMVHSLVQSTFYNLQSTLCNLQWTVRDPERGRRGTPREGGREVGCRHRLRSYRAAGPFSGRRSSTGREWTRDWGRKRMTPSHHTLGTVTDQTNRWGTSPTDGVRHQQMGHITNRRGTSPTDGAHHQQMVHITWTNRRGRVDNQTIITRRKDWLSGLG